MPKKIWLAASPGSQITHIALGRGLKTTPLPNMILIEAYLEIDSMSGDMCVCVRADYAGLGVGVRMGNSYVGN